MDWWIGVLFAVGSVCFALGSFPPYATALGTTPDNITFFIGSIFFTTASFLQYAEVAYAPTTVDGVRQGRARSLLRIRHGRIDWWAAGIQLLGTLWFNRTTLSALLVGLGASPGHHPIWRPDVLGSICFLVSSWLAWVEECHGPFAWRPSRLSWWITSLNLVGSVAFGVSAVASYVTSSGQLLSVALTNLGTFVGAVCFLAGALLLLPERTLEGPSVEPEPEVRPAGPVPEPRPGGPVGTATDPGRTAQLTAPAPAPAPASRSASRSASTRRRCSMTGVNASMSRTLK